MYKSLVESSNDGRLLSLSHSLFLSMPPQNEQKNEIKKRDKNKATD